jgi:hypothetical protein
MSNAHFRDVFMSGGHSSVREPGGGGRGRGRGATVPAWMTVRDEQKRAEADHGHKSAAGLLTLGVGGGGGHGGPPGPLGPAIP